MNYYAITGLINAISSIAIGIFVYLHNRTGSLSKIFVALSLSLGFWSFSYYMWQISTDASSALFWCRMLMVGAIYLSPILFHFISVFLYEEKASRTIIVALYAVFSVFTLLDITPLFVRSVSPKLIFPFWPNPGIAFHVFLIIWFSTILYSFFILFRAYASSSGTRDIQIKYMLIGATLSFLGGGMNYLLWYDIAIIPIGNVALPAFMILMGYVAIKYELFNVKIIVAEVFTLFIWISILVGVILADTMKDRIISGGILFFTVLFGVRLIRSVMNEAQQITRAELLAKEVKDKNEELYAKNDELKYKNVELVSQLAEIQKMNEFMINRELKMIELKKEIEELREQQQHTKK